MFVYTVWEIVDDYRAAGGGEYLLRIFQNKEDAEKYCELMKREAEKDKEEGIFYCVQIRSVY